MPEKPQPSQDSYEGQEPYVFTIPWSEKRKEFGTELANEEMIAMDWDMHENLLFFYLMWLGTY
jgi:hypothetical protein